MIETANQPRDFDIVIVGAGPSAVGLLYGILTNPCLQSLSVAVVDIGDERTYESEFNVGNRVKYNSQNKEQVRDWFRVAHTRSPPIGLGKTRRRTIKLSTLPQTALNHRILDVPIGTGKGGGTNINACFCDAPTYYNLDFQAWPEPWKDGSRIRNAVDHLQTVMRQNGGSTEWKVCSEYNKIFPSDLAFVKNNSKGEALRYSNSQCDAEITFQDSFLVATNSSYERINYFDSILGPLIISDSKARKRLTWITNACVTRIILVNAVAKGVEFVFDNKLEVDKLHIVHARREVILCAGAIISPVILLLSGVGPSNEIPHNIPCQVHLRQVGKKLRDHLLIPRAFLTSCSQKNVEKSINSTQARYNVLATESHPSSRCETNQNPTRCFKFHYMLTDGAISLDAIPTLVASIFRRGKNLKLHQPTERLWLMYADAYIDVFVYLYNFYWLIVSTFARGLLWFCINYIPPFKEFILNRTATINMCIMNPSSSGSVRVKRSATGYIRERDILIDPGYLTKDLDIFMAHQAWKISDYITEQHFKGCTEILPGPLYRWISLKPAKADSAWPIWFGKFLSDFSSPFYHWCGTCSMGESSEDSVVNQYLQVHKILKLRICDASVFSDCISSPTALTCAALGFSTSQFLAESLLDPVDTIQMA